MARKKSWRDMTKGQRIMLLVSGAVNMALLGAAQRSIGKTPDDQIRGKKAIWRAVSFINFFGPVSYFLFGRRRDAEHAGKGAAAVKS
ncbi:PLD nuclease N-terminal domain-containing protein [Paenarthrobacter nitroguajacolicus]|uniref:PLD nuclease N-terminal domain-containing protein n=1 Tax=Paenarthrobacter nitroguajacolicus TaxID=211146 RepID=UPI0006D10444|nr:PLD nuclease N-terminal domain-containing protein [Paenarthrobacter nitroguajacolicus]